MGISRVTIWPIQIMRIRIVIGITGVTLWLIEIMRILTKNLVSTLVYRDNRGYYVSYRDYEDAY